MTSILSYSKVRQNIIVNPEPLYNLKLKHQSNKLDTNMWTQNTPKYRYIAWFNMYMK